MKASLFYDDIAVAASEEKASFSEMLERSFERQLTTGTIISGEIIRIDRDGLLLDIGGKSEGFVAMRELADGDAPANLTELYQVGERVDAMILRETDEDERYTLSIKRVARAQVWQKLSDLVDSQKIVDATILGPTRGGVLANIMGLKGFIPASQLRTPQMVQGQMPQASLSQAPETPTATDETATHGINPAIEQMIGTSVPVKILEVDRNRNKLILSNRAALMEMKATQRSEVLKTLTEDTIVEGHIVKIADFGAFVDIFGIDGLLPLSEITWRRIKHPSDELSIGQKVRVQVLAIDHERQRISLSSKRLLADPWSTVDEVFDIGSEVIGKVSKLLASGALAELIPGVEAFCPYEQHRRLINMEESYVFRVMSISSAERRLTLKYVSSVLEDMPMGELPSQDTAEALADVNTDVAV